MLDYATKEDKEFTKETYMDRMTSCRGFPTPIKTKEEKELYKQLEEKFRKSWKTSDDVDFGNDFSSFLLCSDIDNV